MAESGLRNLRGEAGEKFSWLQKQMLTALKLQKSTGLPGNAAFKKAEATTLQRLLKEEIIRFKYFIRHSKQELTDFLLLRENALATLALIDVIYQEQSGAGHSAPPKEWTAIAKVEAETTLKNIPPAKILMLELKIAGMEAQLEAVGNKLMSLEGALVVPIVPEAPAIEVLDVALILEAESAPEIAQIIPITVFTKRAGSIIRKNEIETSQRNAGKRLRRSLRRVKGQQRTSHAEAFSLRPITQYTNLVDHHRKDGVFSLFGQSTRSSDPVMLVDNRNYPLSRFNRTGRF